MQAVTTDRGDVIHLAGFHQLSPALDRASAPAFSAGAGDGLTRCGWEPFFRAMGERGLAVAFEPGDPSSVRLTRAGERTGAARKGGLAAAVAHSSRFWRALFPRRGRPGAAA